MDAIQKQVYELRDSGKRMDQIRKETGLTAEQVNHFLAERRHEIEEHVERMRLKREGFELGIEL